MTEKIKFSGTGQMIRWAKGQISGENTIRDYRNLTAVQTSIPKNHLSAYQQAAQELGIQLNVAENGQPYGTSYNGTALYAQGKDEVGINYVAINPINNDGSKFDYSKFGTRVRELIKEAQE